LTISNFAGFCYISDSVALAADNDVMSVTFYHDDVWEGNEIEYMSFLLCTFFTIPLQKFSLANLLISR